MLKTCKPSLSLDYDFIEAEMQLIYFLLDLI